MSRLTTLLVAATLGLGGLCAATATQAAPAALAGGAGHELAPAATQIHYRGHYAYRPYYRPYGLYYSAPLYVAPSGCGWLRARALDTGSKYWWRRYRDCIN